MGNLEKVEEAARKAEAIGSDALVKADRLLIKTATLRHEVNRLKSELIEKIALSSRKDQR